MDFEALEAYIEAAPEEFMADVRALVRDDVPPPTIFLGSALAQQITTVDGLHVAAGEEAPPVEA
ncbi:hypothetical protein ABZY10_34640 [Streptomyces sp. NPDC006539]|uniref:hypothetical protein n=1 Tax=Streptomyces sp. NPDC006539 TaxID=3155352 RepID=UPI0033A30067